MNRQEEASVDPLIDEVRARRRDLLAKYQNDLQQLYEAIVCLQSQHPEKVGDRRKNRKAAGTQ